MGSAVSSGQVFRFGQFEADAARNTLTRNGVRVKIQDQPFRVLILLLQCPGEIVTREELRQKLWPQGTYVDFDGSLNVILKKLRAAISDDSENPRFVETIPRRGYRFIAPVLAVAVPTAPAWDAKSKAETSEAAQQTPSPPITELTLVPSTTAARSLRHIYVAALMVAVVGGITWFALHKRQSLAKPYDLSLQASAQVPVRKSVAVLGFHNVSGRPEDAWLSTAFSEMLSTELAGGEKLRLVSGEEVANLRLSSPWPQTDSLDRSSTARIGTALNSDLLVLGSYTTVDGRDRGSVRMDVRLQDAKTGEILTEIAQTGDRQDVLQLVSGVGMKLRTRLGVPQLSEPEQNTELASMPSNRDAARLYSLGLVKLREFDALSSKDLLQQACNADPKFALAHAMLARAWSQLGYEQKRKEEAKKALDLSANLSRVDRMQVQGNYYESLADHEKAASTYRALFELFPDSVEYGLQLAASQFAAGHASQASARLAQLRRLPPPGSDDPRIDLLDARAGPTNDPARLLLIRSAIRKATNQGKRLVYAQARKEECLNLNYSEHPDQAPPACEEAYAIYMGAGNRLGAADAVRLIGDYEGSRGHLEQAIATYQRALHILQDLGDHYKTGTVLNNMAIDFANQGKLDRAEQLYKQAKFHFEQAGDKENTATAVVNLADISFLRGDLTTAAKLYQQCLVIDASLDHNDPGYALYRLGDLALAQGRISDARRLAQQGVDAIRSKEGGYGYLMSAMIVLGAAAEAQGDLTGARQQFQETLETGKKGGELGLLAEGQAELAGLDIEEEKGGQAEQLLRIAIAEFEKEKADPDTTSAYTRLSRALLMQGKTADAEKAIQKAAQLSHASPNPGLTLPIAIQTARVEVTEADSSAARLQTLARARQRLLSAAATAKKLGYYMLESEARLALGELEMKIRPAQGRAQLTALVAEARRHGLELLAQKAERALTRPNLVAASTTSR